MSSDSKVFRIKFFLILLYLAFVGFIVWYYGITVDLEAEKYTEASYKLSKGDFQYPISNYGAFISYILFLLPATLVGNVKLSIIPQILLMLYASHKLFDLFNTKYNNIRLAAIGTSLFLFNFFIQYWTSTLFSESFFISVTTLLITHAITGNPERKNIFTIFFLSVIVVFARPQGIFFVIPTLVYFLKKCKLFTNKRIIPLSLLLVAGAFSYTILHNVSCTYVYRPIAESDIICGFSQTKKLISTPEHCNIIGAHQFLIKEYGLLHDIKLFGSKVVSLFNFTRPYYSDLHNLVLLLNYSILFFCLVRLFYSQKSDAYLFLFQILLLNMILIGITYDEWHGRYLAVLMPVLIILGVNGFNILQKKSRHVSCRDIS